VKIKKKIEKSKKYNSDNLLHMKEIQDIFLQKLFEGNWSSLFLYFQSQVMSLILIIILDY